MKLEYQNRTGLFPEHRGLPIELQAHERVRLTIPAREALQAAGARIAPEPNDGEPQTYTVQLDAKREVPKGLVACRIVGTDHVGIRMEIEPEYPHETQSLWDQVAFSGCPQCGKPLLWYEAGHVPGYRVCTGESHHHVLAS